ncbi:hypothetical protein JZ751_007494 [Albula glossodonta]|uniref:Uncharacterized protein n=1 Tax=Albula glossodonta TaxID=121402 RepID=A0A8T2N9S3_9TELE|nr:hypothetical protein JZ751_007494 [Albula glossodonta]
MATYVRMLGESYTSIQPTALKSPGMSRFREDTTTGSASRLACCSSSRCPVSRSRVSRSRVSRTRVSRSCRGEKCSCPVRRYNVTLSCVQMFSDCSLTEVLLITLKSQEENTFTAR